MKTKFKNLLSLTLLILIPLVSISQNTEKPKVGLVLSGGGAKGIAHLGILHALDSLNIKPDYITGTSMGSIMGALYAIGYSADEIDVIISEGDWDYVLSDDIPLSDIETNKKHNYKRSLIYFNFSGNLIPKLPAGIVYGQHISEYFSKLTWRVADVEDFNEFEIPYKCVSADIISGEPYFFDHGDLSTAMRSSMSIPTVFSPVKIDTLLLVDGGVYRNFPVIDVKEMGADIIIGSYTGFPRTVTFKEMQSLTNVLVRSSTFAGIQDIKNQEDMCDYYIKYDLHGLGTKDFKKGKEIIEYGKESMRNSDVLDSLIALSKLLKKYPPRELKKIPERDSIIIGGINSTGLSMISQDYIISKSGLEIGSKISKDDMTLALNNMMGTLLFNKITYTLKKDENSDNKDSFIIQFDVVEKPRGQMFVSLNYDNFFGPSISVGLMARNLLLSGSEANLKLNLSENPMIYMSYDFFFGKNKKFQTSLNVKYDVLKSKSFFDLGPDLNNINIGSYLTANTDIYTSFAYNFNTNNQLGINLNYQLSKLKYFGGAEVASGVEEAIETGISTELYFAHNNLNKQFYPTKGYKLRASARYANPFRREITFIDENNVPTDSTYTFSKYIQVEFMYKHLIKVGNKISLQPSVQLGLTDNESSLINKFYLGGYSRQERITNINMIGSAPYTYSTDSYLKIDFDIQYEIINNLYLTLLTNATTFIKDTDYSTYEEESHLGAGLTLGYLSPLGPIDAGFSLNDKLENYWHVNIGFPF